MTANHIVVRRLRILGLGPRDHPDPDGLAARMADAARAHLAPALQAAASTGPVLRIRRLEVDVTLGTRFDPYDFAALLARTIAAALRRAASAGDVPGTSAGVMVYPSREAYLAALIEALAEGRAAQSWWLREAEGLRFLSPGAAIRTALLAAPAAGFCALLMLPEAALQRVLAQLGADDSTRVLNGLAAAGGSAASFESCMGAVVAAVLALPEGAAGSPLNLYLRACARQPGLAGTEMAEAARLWASLAALWHESGGADAASWLNDASPEFQGAPAFFARHHILPAADAAKLRALPHATRDALASALRQRGHRTRAGAAARPDHVLSRFGGLALLLPTLQAQNIADRIGAGPAADLIAYAALGLCAGRPRFQAWLNDGFWREAFGIDPRADLAGQLAGIDAGVWDHLAPLAPPLTTARDARFLLPPHRPAGGRVLARLARAASAAFARRLIGFGAASAPFLWDNLLGSGAVFERVDGGWKARLARPPLDILLSLSGIAEGTVQAPAARLHLSRAPR